MKLISKGLVNKIIAVDEEKIRSSNEPVDQMNLAFQTPNSPYRSRTPLSRNPMNDPNLFIVYFQRIL